ncbi:hypothetical protein EV714DRAFT_276382 [Schizophyllum commune]
MASLPASKRICTTSPAKCTVKRPSLFLDTLPNDILDLILADTSPADLQGLRAANPKLRDFIDSKHYLIRAIRRAKLPSIVAICDRYPDATHYLPASLKPYNMEDTLPYNLMLVGGQCTVCGKYAGGPPLSSNLRVRLCGEDECSRRMCSDEFTTCNWTIDTPNYVQQGADNYAEIPYMNDLPSLSRRAILPSDDQCAGYRSRYILREFNTSFYAWGMDIYGWSVFSDAKNLHGSLEPIHWALCEWREWVSEEGRSVQRENLRILGEVARECATTLERLLKDPLTQRILWAHARDCAPVYWTTFRYLLDPRLDRRDEARVKKSATSLSPTLPKLEVRVSVKRRPAPGNNRKALVSRSRTLSWFTCAQCQAKFNSAAKVGNHCDKVHSGKKVPS